MNRVRNRIGLNRRLGRDYTGRGVTIAVLDSGAYMHPDYKERLVAFYDFTSGREKPYDNNGHGTHVAGILCGNGKLSAGVYRGMAPQARLVVGKVLNKQGAGNISRVMDGIDWVIENRKRYGIRILNLSMGTPVSQDTNLESVFMGKVEQAWRAGIVVVTAAGNQGPKPDSITSPGIGKHTITVGACDDDKGVQINGKWYINYSGRGGKKTRFSKPDLVAPGMEVVSAKPIMGRDYINASDAYMARSGTSMSVPVVAGSIALLLEKEPWLTPDAVKQRVCRACRTLKRSPYYQGHGLLWVPWLLQE